MHRLTYTSKSNTVWIHVNSDIPWGKLGADQRRMQIWGCWGLIKIRMHLCDQFLIRKCLTTLSNSAWLVQFVLHIEVWDVWPGSSSFWWEFLDPGTKKNDVSGVSCCWRALLLMKRNPANAANGNRYQMFPVFLKQQQYLIIRRILKYVFTTFFSSSTGCG